MDADLKSDLLFFGLLTVGGITTAVGVYLLIKRYFPLGKVSFNGQERTLTEEDKLWAARMVVGETGGDDPQSNAAVLWSVLTRWLTKPSLQGMSWAQVMRAFSQPINPQWADASAPGCTRQPSACTETNLARRRQITSMPWSSIPQSVRDQVEAFARGRVANPIPGLNNFAAAGAIGGSQLSSSELPPRTIGGNTFIRDPGSLQGEVRFV